MHHVLITGASGFVGSQLACELRKSGHKISGVVRHRGLPLALKDFGVSEIQADLLDEVRVEVLLRELAPDTIIHCAALADSSACERDPNLAHTMNVDMTRILVEKSTHILPHANFLLCSSDLVFDGGSAPVGGFTELDLPQPASVYGKTKRDAENIVLGSPHGRVLRLSLVFGDLKLHSSGFLQWMVGTLLKHQPLTLFTDEWRTPIYIPDIARVIERGLHSELLPLVLHIGGPERLSRFEFGQILCDAMGAPREYLAPRIRADVPSIYTRPRDVSLNTNLLQNMGLQMTTVRKALSEILHSAPNFLFA